MINPWLLVSSGVLIIASYFYGYSTGYDVSKSAGEAEKSIATKEAMDNMIAATDKVKSLEQQLATKQNKVEKVYVNKIRTVEVESKRITDIARNNGLFVNASCANNSNPLPDSASGSSSSNGTQKARLSREASEALISIAADADTIVHQLTACQAILEAERQ